MFVALFALAQLLIFRKPTPPPPPPSSSSSRPQLSRCGKATKANSAVSTSAHLASSPTIYLKSKMSTNADQEQGHAIAANGNAVDPNAWEIIHFNEKHICRSIKTNNARILASSSVPTRGSSKVKLKNIVDYKWERKYYYPGHLVAVHRDGKHLAYAINVNNKATGMEGMVRVCNISTSMRALIKGMSGEVLDLQFAHTDRERILAVIDMSSLFVYKIDLIEGNLLCNLVLKVEDPIANYQPEYDMVSWCPYVCNSTTAGVPSEDDDENQLLIWSRSRQFQVFHVKMIINEHGRGKINPDVLEAGYLKIEEDSLITCAALSPDGTTVAAACADGLVRFYQIYFFDVRNPRCLHEWKPHDGKKVNSLFFLDNINKPVEESYWQHVITTSDSNTEIKLWNCSLWECLQTIEIATATAIQGAQFIAGIDRSANYLVVSCLDNLAVYVMQIGSVTGSEAGDAGSDLSDGEGTDQRIQNVAEFKLSSGILSFSIVNAAMRRLKSSVESYYPVEEPDDFDDENNSTYALVVHMFVVQAKSLQECHIIYQPCVPEKTERKSLISSSSIPSKRRSATPEDNLLILKKDTTVVSPNSVVGVGAAAGSVPLDALFAKSAKRTAPTVGSSSSAVVAMAVASAAAPSAILQQAIEATTTIKSRSTSPQFGSAFPQVNLMTPDAFSASGTQSSSTATTAVVVATSTTTSTGTDAAACASTAATAATYDIDSQVLNTLRMLATVTAGKASENSNANILNLMNNTLIEDREQQKVKDKLEARKKFIAIDRNPERNLAENLASGGSSPSREVQEIMATRDDGDDAYEPELENLDDDNDDDDDEEEELANSSPLLDTVDAKWLAEAAKVKPIKKSAELQNAAQIMSQAVQHKNNGNVPPTLGGGGNINTTSVASNSNNNTGTTLNTSNSSSHNAVEGESTTGGNAELNNKIDLLLDLVKSQSKQLNKLETEVSKLQQQLQQTAPAEQPAKGGASLEPKNVNQLAYKIEMQLSKLMEQYLKRYENEHTKKLSEFLLARENQNRELRESVVAVLNQYVLTHFTDIIGNVLNMELQRQLVPRVNAKMDQLQAQIQVEFVQKLGVFEKAVKENIAQVCKSQQFMDSFGKSVLIGVQTSLQTAFIESMGSTLIPAYEKSSQNMFQQLHDAFTVGIKDFMVQFNAYLQQMPQQQGAGAANWDELNNKLGLLKQLVESNLLKHRTELTDAMLETQREVKSLEILLARQVQETIRAELRKFLENQNLALRSQAATPAQPYDLRDNIKQLLHAGQINKAFHQALLANDLNLVEYTLRHTDSNQAFAPDACRLEQKVLLSLIQQISADMTNHNELKQRYLNEALLAINMADPITREHAPKVLAELFRNCQLFIKNCPKSTQCSNVRLLMKAIMTYRDQLK